MVHETEIKKIKLSEPKLVAPAVIPAVVPTTGPTQFSQKTRELALMNMTIVILEEVKFLRKQVSDLESDVQRVDARNRKQGKSNKRRHSPLHISRQRSFCNPDQQRRTKRRISIRIIPSYQINPLPIQKRKTKAYHDSNTGQ